MSPTSIDNVTRPAISAQPDPNGTSADHVVNRLGYRGWSGALSSGGMRWMVISGVGIRRAWQSRWLRRMLFLAWLPAVWFGVGFFLWEQATLSPEWRQTLRPVLRGMPPTPEFNEIREAVRSGNMESGRHTVWAWLLQSFFRYPQGVLMVMVIGLIAPPLISQDIRSRAFLLYFSRPLTRGEYLLGKLASLWVYLSLISTLPALALYLLGVLLSPNLSVVSATWELPLRILAASVVLMLPTSVLALCFSSLTQESRYAGFAWFAVWILGWFTYGAATSAEVMNAQRDAMRTGQPMVLEESSWTHLSPYHTLGRVQSWVFGFSEFRDVRVSMGILIALTLIALGVLFHRISAPMRV